MISRYDINMLKRQLNNKEKFNDTLIISAVQNSNRHSNLKKLASKFFGGYRK